MGTAGTAVSNSYPLEIAKFSPTISVIQQSCPMWVPLVENNTFMEKGGQYYIKKYVDELLEKEPRIDTIVLACTHYPILKECFEKALGPNVEVYSQGKIVADSLVHYLKRHPIFIESGDTLFLTTGDVNKVSLAATRFLGKKMLFKSA